mmetsp:Transcript_6077/g.13432  ORF Transcript_6077/g.13432 Transcript_6077/m.13432 type:complete len:162 (+) Transcript_6077:684-1169(+)
MLEAKAEVGHLSPAELVMMDSKVFEIGGKKLRISVIETTKPDKVLQFSNELKEAMITMREQQQLDDIILLVVDILQERSVFVSSSESATKLVERAWQCSVGPDGTAILANVLSRKKQIVPAFESAAAGAPPIRLESNDRVEPERAAPRREGFLHKVRAGLR